MLRKQRASVSTKFFKPSSSGYLLRLPGFEQIRSRRCCSTRRTTGTAVSYPSLACRAVHSTRVIALSQVTHEGSMTLSMWGSCIPRQARLNFEDAIVIPNSVVQEIPTGSLYAGQCGYITCNMKESAEAHIGDTLHIQGAPVEAMPGFQPAKAMVVSTGHDLYHAWGSYLLCAVRRRLSRGQRRLSQARGSAEAAHFD
jgi:hypothetical protein